MLTTVLAAALGFLAALFLVLLVAPAIARRISDLTWRQAERVLPQSMEEIAAARDHLRGAHAMALRKLELSRETLNDRFNMQRVDMVRATDRITALEADVASRDASLERMGIERDGQTAALAAAESRIAASRTEAADLAVRLDTVEGEAATLRSDNKRLRADAERAQAEAEGQGQALAKAQAELAAQRAAATALESELKRARADLKVHEQESKFVARKVARLEASLQKAIARMADAEEKVARSERDGRRAKPMAAPLELAPVRAERARPAARLMSLDDARAAPAAPAQAGSLREAADAFLADAQAGAANPTERAQLTARMMDIAAQAVAQAATGAEPLKSKLDAVTDNGALGAAIKRRVRQARA